MQIPIPKHVHMSSILIKTFEIRGRSSCASPFTVPQILILVQCDLIKTLTRDYIGNMTCTFHMSLKARFYTCSIYNPNSIHIP